MVPKDCHHSLPGPLYLNALEAQTGYCRLASDCSDNCTLNLLTTKNKHAKNKKSIQRLWCLDKNAATVDR
jgi:hypothetical protein